METLFLVNADNFDGSAHSTVTNGYVDFSGYLYNNKGPNLTIEEYRKIPGHENLTTVTGEQLDAMLKKYYDQKYLSQPIEEISEGYFFDMLEILPPGGWTNNGTFEKFYMIERQAGNITRQFARLGDRYITKFIDLANRDTWIKPGDFPD